MPATHGEILSVPQEKRVNDRLEEAFNFQRRVPDGALKLIAKRQERRELRLMSKFIDSGAIRLEPRRN